MTGSSLPSKQRSLKDSQGQSHKGSQTLFPPLGQLLLQVSSFSFVKPHSGRAQ